MAALASQGFGGSAPAAPPPVPSGKPKVWKRPAAAEPVIAEPAPEKPKSKWVVEEAKPEDDGRVEKSGEDFVAPVAATQEGDMEADPAEVERPATTAATEDDAPEEEVPEDDEEAAEKARRFVLHPFYLILIREYLLTLCLLISYKGLPSPLEWLRSVREDRWA